MSQDLHLVGHQETYRPLEELRQSGQLPHAMLFLGAEGIGKQIVAKNLASSLLSPDATPIDTSELENHPDFFWIEPDGGRIKIEVVRNIKKSLVYPPLKSKRRVVIFNDAHTMNLAASNALLKSLEEPPAETYFILITHSLGWIPKTIVSRCHKFNFSPLRSKEIQKVLQNLGREASHSSLQWAQGSVLRAIQLEELEGKIPSLDSLFSSPQAISFEAAYSISMAVLEEDQLNPFLHSLLGQAHQRLTSDPRDRSQDFDLLNFADRILEIRRLLRQNINPKMHLTRLLLYFQEPKESRL